MKARGDGLRCRSVVAADPGGQAGEQAEGVDGGQVVVGAGFHGHAGEEAYAPGPCGRRS